MPTSKCIYRSRSSSQYPISRKRDQRGKQLKKVVERERDLKTSFNPITERHPNGGASDTLIKFSEAIFIQTKGRPTWRERTADMEKIKWRLRRNEGGLLVGERLYLEERKKKQEGVSTRVGADRKGLPRYAWKASRRFFWGRSSNMGSKIRRRALMNQLLIWLTVSPVQWAKSCFSFSEG